MNSDRHISTQVHEYYIHFINCMKVNLKNLKGQVFALEVEPSAPVSLLKERIEADKGFSKESMKIIYKGKTLKDDEQLEKLGIKQTDFLVVMNQVSKPASKPKVEEKSEPKPEKTEQKSEVKPSLSKQSKGQPSSEPSQAQINDMVAMGFPREQCIAALRAAFGNVERAVQYLFNGIPENPPPGHPPASSLLASLQNNPQFQELRTQLQSDPNSLPQILGQIGQTSPDLYNLIMEHPDEFEHILGGGEEDGDFDEEGEYGEGQLPEGQEGAVVISEEEEAAINRLSALGFSKIESAQAYMACDKNEELAANLLFERLANGDLEQSFPSNSADDDDDNLFN